MTEGQKRRAAEIGALASPEAPEVHVRPIPEGSVLIWVKAPHGYWLEVAPPEPDVLLAFDFRDES